MTVAAYLRVSTRRQNDDGQRAEVRKWLDANGIDPKKVTWYCDKESGAHMRGQSSTGCRPTSSAAR